MTSQNAKQRPWLFPVVFVAAILVILLLFNLISEGRFLEPDNLMVIISHLIYPCFIAWGFCFLFACGYTDMSIGGVVVLGSFASCIFGNWFGLPGVVLGGLITGMLLIFCVLAWLWLNHNVKYYERIGE